MRWILGLALAGPLAACYSTDEVRATAPAWQETVRAPVTYLLPCLAGKLAADFKPVQQSYSPQLAYLTLALEESSVADFEMRGQSDGTTTVLWRRAPQMLDGGARISRMSRRALGQCVAAAG